VFIEIVSTPLGANGRRIRTLVTSRRVRQVDFLLDGARFASDQRFPFNAEIKDIEDASRLQALAFDAEGAEIARAEVELDSLSIDLAVTISDVQPVEGTGWLEVSVKVRHSSAASVARVDFYRGDHFAASTTQAPFRALIPQEDGSPFLRAVAHLEEGGWAEGVHVLGSQGVADELAVNLVEIYAMVSDQRGVPVTGLGAADFQVLQGNEPRPLERFSIGDDVPLSVALVIDGSASMFDVLEEAKAAARLFLERALDQGDGALMLDFDLRPRLLQPRTSNVEELIERFSMIESRGGSAIYDAIIFGLLQLQKAPGRRALIILTDGLDSSSQFRPEECVDFARRTGVPIFAISMGQRLDIKPSHRTYALRQLTEKTGGRVYEISKLDQIAAAYNEINLQLRGQYLLGFAASGELSTTELDDLFVRIPNSKFSVRTILGGQLQLMN
jgi:Ca-activated chloride channel family protein